MLWSTSSRRFNAAAASQRRGPAKAGKRESRRRWQPPEPPPALRDGVAAEMMQAQQAVPRIGVDLVHIADIGESVAAFGDRYLQRIFTRRELDAAGAAAGQAQPLDLSRLAARYAAKEALLKVLRPVGHWFNWQLIEVVGEPGGWVSLELHGAARARAEAEGLRQFSVSLSHEKDYAIAVVSAAC